MAVKAKEKSQADILERVAAVASQWKDRPDMLIPVLHQVQSIAGNSIPKDVMETVAREMRISPAEISGVESFYSFFSKEQRGKIIIRLCKSVPCHVTGNKGVLAAFEEVLGIKAGETTPDGIFTLETCECIGACDVAPAALIGDTVFGNLTPAKVADLVSSLREEA